MNTLSFDYGKFFVGQTKFFTNDLNENNIERHLVLRDYVSLTIRKDGVMIYLDLSDSNGIYISSNVDFKYDTETIPGQVTIALP